MIVEANDYFFFSLDDQEAQKKLSEQDCRIRIEKQSAIITAPFQEAVILGWNATMPDKAIRSECLQLNKTGRSVTIFFIQGAYQDNMLLTEVLAFVTNPTEHTLHRLFMDEQHNWFEPGLNMLGAGDAATNEEIKDRIKGLRLTS